MLSKLLPIHKTDKSDYGNYRTVCPIGSFKIINST